MDLNICSRRVHDGYATIRARPRNRPRAVYRSDSEELLKETDGLYALPTVSNVILKNDNNINQVPRWSEQGKNILRENYGTLRKKNNKNLKIDKPLILNSFASQKNFKKNNEEDDDDEDDNDIDKHLYDTVASDDYSDDTKSITSTSLNDKLSIQSSLDLNSSIEDTKISNEDIKIKQPIYATPNIKCIDNDNDNDDDDINNNINDNKNSDINYVPSGDLYRTTTKFIENINKNIAEIDKSYEELCYNVKNNSVYGVINKLKTSSSSSSSPDNDNNLYNYPRKRNMEPMPPITIDIDDKLLIDNDDKYNIINNKKNTYNHKNLFKKRTNSFGRHPPKLLPRLSSIDNNNTLRHSTGSTTTTSSTKSNESLCAISESLNELTINNNNNYNNDVEIEESSLVTLRIKDQSISFKNSEIIDPGTESDDEFINEKKINTTNCKSKIDNYLSLSSSSFDYSNNHQVNIINSNNNFNNYSVKFKKRCDTLPSRKLKSITRTICKSTNDVLDNVVVDNKNNTMLKDENNKINNLNKKYNNRYSSLSRTRHGSLDSDDDVAAVATSNVSSGFATLPRRRETITTVNNDGQINRRLSGNIVPVLEPLYEHAVSNPVKPRGNTNVIPWWELATKKYRHRSCPSLQAHVVSAFEQSLQNMTQRLQQLTATAEKKDSELQELRDTIERLRKQSAEATLNNSTSPNGRRHTLGESDNNTTNVGTNYNNHQDTTIARQLSADSVTSLNSLSSACSISSHNKKKGWLRSSFSKAFSRSRKNRHGSVSDADDCKDIGIIGCGELSVPNSPRLPTSVKHENSHNNHHDKINNGEKSPDYIDNELTDNNSTSGLFKKDEDVDELKKQLREKDLMMTDIRLEALSSAHQLVSLKDHINKMRNEMLNLKQDNERLQRLVTSKSLTSSQSSLPSDPDRRFSMTEVSSSNVVAGLTNGDTHTTTVDQLDDLQITQSNSSQIINNNINNTSATSTTATINEPNIEQETDGKRINIAIYIGSENNFNFNLISSNNDGVIGEPPHSIISNVCISNKTTWDSLDSTVRRYFKDYINRVDPITNLGLGIDCLSAYHIGEASRYTNDTQYPELLPCGYLVGHVKTIYIVLSGYSWLAIDTLIPRSIVQRLVSQLSEHRRLILCGPSGAGKSYLAGKLANAFVDFDNNDCKDISSVATFNVDHNTSKELRQYLVHIAERCASNAGDELPRVIILENLQHATSLGELFSGLPGTNCLPGTRNTLSSCPAIIGTMSQATCNTTNLQLHHNFRWVLFANNMEPVKGFLGRYLRRKLLEHELKDSNNFIGNGIKNSEMAAVVEWLPRVWLHLNKFLEGHSSTDVTIGPRLFLSCPMEISGSQVWFTDLWNYSVIPYLVETVREGLALYGRRQSTNSNGNNNNNNNNNDCTWEDPTQFIVTTYPWISSHAVHGGSDALLRLRPDDVGYDDVGSGHNSGVGASSVKSLGSTHSDTEGDPLLNMLMRLQEAANYSNPHGNDSDSVTSLDSSHTRHSEELNTSTSSSRGVESAL